MRPADAFLLVVGVLLVAPTGLAVGLLGAGAPLDPSGLVASAAAPPGPPALTDGGLWVPRAADAGSGPEPYDVRFKCPFGAPGSPDVQTQVDGTICPQYVIDLEDLLGQGRLAVDPYNPDVMAFHALHGGRGLPPSLLAPDPPTPRSRYNVLHQPHTTFQTGDGGQGWVDMRYYATDALLEANRTIYGEDNAITLDAQGRGYIASLYSWRDVTDKQWHWTVAVYKTQRINRPVSYTENYAILHKDVPESNNTLSALQLVYSRETNRVVLLWLETAAKNATTPNHKSSWVQAYWTVPGDGARWEPLTSTQLVGPCKDLADPVAFGGLVYFGCLPDKGYAYGGNGSVDDWQIHSLDTRTWETRYVAPTPINTPHLRLVDMGRTGHMFLVGSGVVGGQPVVKVSQGALGRFWSDPTDYGSHYRLLPENSKTPIVDARITAAAYTLETSYLHTVYMEHYGSAVDPGNLQGGAGRSFNKTYAVLRPVSNRFEGAFNQLHFGRPVTAAEAGPAFTGVGDSIFDDLHDDIVVWHDPNARRERIFTVFGDYGAERFAEVLEDHTGIPVVLPPINLPALPLAAAETAANSTGAITFAISGLMLLRMLVAKKKTIAKAPTL